jgi:chitodextrinase
MRSPRLFPLPHAALPCALALLGGLAAPARAQPLPPASVTVVSVGCDRVDLVWTAPAGGGADLFGYKVLRDGVFLTWILAPATAATDTQTVGPATHVYTVVTVDVAGEASAPSRPAAVAVPSCADRTPPAAPTLTVVAPTGCTAVLLAWSATTDAGSGLREYRLYRNGVLARTVAPTVTAVIDTGLAPSSVYWYAVAAVDGAGNQSLASAPVTLTTPACSTNQPPVADAGADRVAPTLTALTFDGRNSRDADGSIVAYRWEFGDGTIASTAVATHLFRRPGVYGVRLTVTDDDGAEASDVALLTATNRPPIADAGRDRVVVAGTSVVLDGRESVDLDGTITAYAWTFGDGGAATGALAQRTYAGPGTYTARLTVTDDAGGTATDTAVIMVTPKAPDGGGDARRFGGPGTDLGHAVAFDTGGNIVLGGRVDEGAEVGGRVLPGTRGGANGVVVKLSPDGTPLWSRVLGTSDAAGVEAVAVDGGGNVAVSGWFRGSVDLGGGPVAGVEDLDAFVAKYAADGRHLWSRVFGAERTDIGYGVAFDPAGDVVVTGTFQRTVDFGGGDIASRLGGLDLFVAKLRGTDGAHLWSRSFWNYGDDIAYGLSTDTRGDVLVTGFFGSTIDFGGGALEGTATNNAFLVKLAGADGGHLWSRALTATSSGRGYGVAADRLGGVVVTGFFEGTLRLPGRTLEAGGPSDTFVARYAGADGALRWVTSFPSNGADTGHGVAVDGSGNVTLAGQFWGEIWFGPRRLVSVGRSDVFVARLGAADGVPYWADVYGGFGNDYGYGVASAPGGRIAVTGYFTDEALLGGAEVVSAGGADGFVVTVDP